MFDPDENGIYATVNSSGARRIFACTVLYGLGALLVYVALSGATGLGGKVGLLGFGALVLVLGEKLRHATRLEIELTETEVRDSTGRVLTLLEDVVSVERGAFALKPSNGFTMVLRNKAPRAWVPGMWWRMGRRVGVGGTTGAGASKFMAEQISFRIAQR